MNYKKLGKKLAALVGASVFFLGTVSASPRIEINLPTHTLSVFDGGTLLHSYPVAIGKYSTPTPMGEYSILDMGENPIWTDPETMESVESGDWNPLGYRWIGFYGRYGIHGNNNPSSIGHSVSNGCVRMYEDDVEELYEIVDIGTPVDIVYQRVVVDTDSSGQAFFAVYPDCYDEQPLEVADVRSIIQSAGGGEVSDADIEDAIDEESGEPIFFNRLIALTVNGKPITEKGIRKGKKVLYPIKAIANALGIPVVWADGRLMGNGFVLFGEMNGDTPVTDNKEAIEGALHVKIDGGEIVSEPVVGGVSSTEFQKNTEQINNQQSFSPVSDSGQRKKDAAVPQRNVSEKK